MAVLYVVTFLKEKRKNVLVIFFTCYHKEWGSFLGLKKHI